MNWLIHQLFGAHATDHLTDKIKAFVSAYLLASPNASRAAVIAAATAKIDTFVPSVLKYFPGWAAQVLEAFLLAAAPSLIGKVYDEIVKAVTPAAPGAASATAS